jgi:hypothetical protein
LAHRRVGILSNPYAGTGRENILAQTRRAHACLAAQAEIVVGPDDLGEWACLGHEVRVVGQSHTKTRRDTIETTRAFVREGVDLIVIIAGDGTYNDALEGMKLEGVVLPIFGIAAGRFNTLYPKRRHDPFVSIRGSIEFFDINDLVVDDVPGLVTRIDGAIVSYGFFWFVVHNALAYTEGERLVLIDAAEMLEGRVTPLTEVRPVATEATVITLESERLGSVELARGKEVSMPIVAHIVDELNQIVAGGFGTMAQLMSMDGVAYCFLRTDIPFLPTPEFFPVDTRSLGFFAGDRVRMMGFSEGAVVQVDSTPIRALTSRSIVEVEVVRALGKKARLP